MSYIYVIDGEKGAGKTSFMSLFAYDMKMRFPDLTLWSNYELRGSRLFTSYTDFLEMAKLDNNLVVWDESYIDLDSRNASSNKGQMYLTQVFNLLRKFRATVMLTAVSMSTLDSRVREEIDVYVFARVRGQYTEYEFYDFRNGRLLKRSMVKRDLMKRVLNEMKLFKTWRPVIPIQQPNKDTFPEFHKQLVAYNDNYYKVHQPEMYSGYEDMDSMRIVN
ncbi:hypothetical protein [Brevibacillus daliensis]|uniref:hypothetical protein n=1 Tax=Brevibacillus daliensis TaxID=2892995 RepID=UPI001E4AF74F|nr:hypothetical protein [Brevibacillus daliensis]